MATEVTSSITNNTTPGYKCLKDIVKRTLLEDNETSMHKYALYKSYAIDFLRDFKLDAARDIKSIELAVDSVNRVQLPDDYLDYVKIGVKEGDRIKVFLRDDSLATIWGKDDCGDDVKNPTFPDFADESVILGRNDGFLFSNYVNTWGEHTGGIYGFGNGVISEGFKIYKDHIVLTSTVVSDTIILEYICNGMIYGEETMIPVQAEEACKSYIRWKLTENDRMAPIHLVDRFKSAYSNNRRLTVIRTNKLSVQDIYNSMREAFSMAPKT